MSSQNPYSPGNSPAPQPLDMDDESQRCLWALKRTRPWVRLIGILTAIVASLSGIASFIALLAAASGRASLLVIVFLYGAMAALYGFAAKFLLFYAGSITRAEASLKLHDIADALEHQKSFWKLIGISAICSMVLWLIFILLSMLGSAFSTIGLFGVVTL